MEYTKEDLRQVLQRMGKALREDREREEKVRRILQEGAAGDARKTATEPKRARTPEDDAIDDFNEAVEAEEREEYEEQERGGA